MAKSRNQINKDYCARNPEWARAQAKKYRLKNRDRLIAASRAKYLVQRQAVNDLKTGPCADCERHYPPYVMEFHHRDPSQKIFKIAAGLVSARWDRVITEIAKCDLLCANCHRIREWGENGMRRRAA